MKKQIETEILINTSPEKAWTILTNFNDYPNWNPFIKSINGDVKVGNKIKVKIEPPEAKGMIFKPKVLTYEANKELRWVGHLLITGLFDGEHKFEIVDNGNGTVTFKHSEKFKGILVPLFKKQIENNILRGFNDLNRKLKELAEHN